MNSKQQLFCVSYCVRARLNVARLSGIWLSVAAFYCRTG